MPNMMAALLNIGGTLCSTPQSLADAPTQVPCNNAVNIGERKTWAQSEFCTWYSITEQEPPKMNILCTSPGDVKDRTKFGLLPLSDVAAVMLPRCETR